MKYILYTTFIVLSIFISSCSTVSSGSAGITDTEIATYTESINRFDLDVDTEGITYTIDISTAEGILKLKGLTLSQAYKLALDEAAIKNNCARIISPKFSHLMKGTDILRVTVFGFPARYKNSQKTATPDKEPPMNKTIIVK